MPAAPEIALYFYEKCMLTCAIPIMFGHAPQGQLGDCWMMTAMASMAQYPGAVHNMFVTKEYVRNNTYPNPNPNPNPDPSSNP